MIIGITGTDGAGKGAIVDYLVKEKGFTHYSARALITVEIEKRGLPLDRAMLRTVANDMRHEHGNDVIIQKGIEAMERDGVCDAVIESLRTTAEVETLKKHDGVLLAADADQELRYKRIHERGSITDDVTFETFTANEALEMNDPNPNGMQKAKVMQMADYTILNDVSLEELHRKIDEVLTQIENSDS